MEWKDISLGMFSQIQAIIQSESEDLTKKIELYSLLTGKDMNQVREVPLGEFLEAYKKELSFINQDIPQVIPKSWEHGGVNYNICTQVEKLTAGQYIDLKEYAKEPNNLHNVMAVLCYEGDKYNGINHKERAEVFRSNMPITIAYPLSVFFFDLWNVWSEVSLQYSELMLKQIQVDLPENTAG